MASNAQKTPLAESLNIFAQQKAQTAIQQLGKALPCSVVSVQGAIVRVKFEVQSGFTLPVVTVPLFGPEYIRYPIQKGDKGVVFPADVYLGGMSGLGGGVADLTQRGNLSALVFFPIGNKNWSPTDANSVTIYGPNGVTMRDTGNTASIVVHPNSIVFTVGGNTITINGSSISLSGTVIIDGREFLSHHHSGVQTGGGSTGNVV